MNGVRIIVRGRVQGVGFRYFTKRTADALGIKGWVRNLPDGDVEAFAYSSDEDLLAKFIDQLREGPSQGHVSQLITEESGDSSTYDSFEITY